MALYEVVLRQSYFSQSCLAVFNYFVPPVPLATPNSLELLTLMGFIPTGDPLAFPADTIAAQLAGVQNSEVDFLSVEARELYSLTDFYEAVYSPAISGTGGSGEAMTPFVAYGLYSARVRTDIRRSQKRFVGVSEGSIYPGGEVSDTMIASLVDLAELMSATLEGAAADYQPCTISREKVVETDPPRTIYRLYESEAEQEEHIATPLVWTPHEYVRSQTSRQYGRGS